MNRATFGTAPRIRFPSRPPSHFEDAGVPRSVRVREWRIYTVQSLLLLSDAPSSERCTMLIDREWLKREGPRHAFSALFGIATFCCIILVIAAFTGSSARSGIGTLTVSVLRHVIRSRGITHRSLTSPA